MNGELEAPEVPDPVQEVDDEPESETDSDDLSAPDTTSKSLTDGDFYGGEEEEKDGKAQNEPAHVDFTQVLDGGSSAEPEEESEEEPAASKEEKPTTAKEEPKGEEADDDEWDRERQRRDQEAANNRKAVDALTKSVDDQKKVIEDLQAQLKSGVAKGGQTQADSETADELAQLMSNVDKLTEDSRSDEVIETLKAVAKRLATLAKGDSGAESKIAKELATEVADLKKKIIAREEADRATAAQAAQDGAVQDLRKHIGKLDGHYGDKFKAPARDLALKMLEEDGFNEKNQPPLRHAKRVFSLAYAQVVSQTPAPKAKQKPAGIRPDTGTGGVAEPPEGKAKIKDGSLKAVIGQMKKVGVRNL